VQPASMQRTGRSTLDLPHRFRQFNGGEMVKSVFPKFCMNVMPLEATSLGALNPYYHYM